MLRGGKLLLFCKDVKQQKKTLGMKMLLGKKVSSIQEEKKWVRGVITGIPTDNRKKNISGKNQKEYLRSRSEGSKKTSVSQRQRKEG